MKSPIFRSFLLVILILLLFTSLTGCEDMDYRDAIRLYNDGDYVHENYNAKTGEGLYAAYFSWSCVFVRQFIMSF